MKISAANKRDFIFYFKNRNRFNFSGTLENSYEPIYDRQAIGGIEAFFKIENNGGKLFPEIRPGVKGVRTKHQRLLETLLLSKASVNFNIKAWAEDRAKGYLPKVLFNGKDTNGNTIKGFETNNIIAEFNCPKWVEQAVENQASRNRIMYERH